MSTKLFTFVHILQGAVPTEYTARSELSAPAYITGSAIRTDHGLKFHRYVSGLAELPWLTGKKIDGRICETAATKTLIDHVQETLVAARNLRQDPTTLSFSTADPRVVLSQMVMSMRRRRQRAVI